jgi:hypothetical protein
MPKKFDIDKFNLILSEHDQKIRAIHIDGKEIVLSNQVTITKPNEILRCKRRVMGHAVFYLQRFDRLYSEDETDATLALSEAKSLTSSLGGVACQQQHGEKIRNNLNVGIPWNKGMTGLVTWQTGLTKDDHPALKRMSESRKGSGNPMYGTTMSQENKIRASNRMKRAILDGSFTPNTNNRNTHWQSTCDGKSFRSSWEALYQSIDNDAEYETLRITYTHNDTDCIYIVDFVNHITKHAIEVKPKKMHNDKKTRAKIDALGGWCEENNYTMILADEEFLVQHEIPSPEKFDENTYRKIEKLYETYKQTTNRKT